MRRFDEVAVPDGRPDGRLFGQREDFSGIFTGKENSDLPKCRDLRTDFSPTCLPSCVCLIERNPNERM
jgi:hypothetical protein